MEWLMEITGAHSEIEAIYWLIASVSSAYLLLKIFLNFWGLDLDMDIDLESDLDLDLGLGHYDISLSSIIAFFAAGGWAGVLLLREIGNPLLAHIIAFFIGLITMIGTIVMYGKLKGLESSGNIDLKNAIGKIGTVYLSILPEKGGQVTITIQGRRYTFDALTEDKEIKTGQKVLVYNVKGNKLIVEPFNDEFIVNELLEEIPTKENKLKL